MLQLFSAAIVVGHNVDGHVPAAQDDMGVMANNLLPLDQAISYLSLKLWRPI